MSYTRNLSQGCREELISPSELRKIIEAVETHLGTPCMVCGESVPIFNPREAPKICDKCKAAIMKMREDSNHD